MNNEFKTRAREKFVRENSSWNKETKIKKPPMITKEMLEKIISLYPSEPNRIIAEKVGLDYGQLTHLVLLLRKKKVVLEKKKKFSMYDGFDDAFSKLEL